MAFIGFGFERAAQLRFVNGHEINKGSQLDKRKESNVSK